jgi:hypothetical protein
LCLSYSFLNDIWILEAAFASDMICLNASKLMPSSPMFQEIEDSEWSEECTRGALAETGCTRGELAETRGMHTFNL